MNGNWDYRYTWIRTNAGLDCGTLAEPDSGIWEMHGGNEQMLSRSTPLGLFTEEIAPTMGEHLGNFPQAFFHIGVINVAVSLAHIGHTGNMQPQHKAES